MTTETEIEDISVPDGWTSRTLGELADEERGITYGIVQPGQNTIDGVPIIRVQNLADGTLDTSDVMRVAPEIAAKYRRTCLRGGELLLSLVGSVGSSVIAPPEIAGWNTARAVAVVPLRPGVDARYVRFCLRSAPLQHLMEVWCNTTVQATLNLADVSRLPIPMPTQREREAIVEALGALDDKIELNQQMNRALEHLLAVLFRSWFVDFDPVVAKAAGRQPVHLRPELAALFPAHWQDSPLGPIPHGWRVANIGDVVTVVGGSTPSTNEPKFWNGNIAWATPRDLAALTDPVLIATARQITAAGLNQIGSGLLPKGAVLLSSRAPIGYTAIADIPVAVNQGFIALICDGPLPNYYVIEWVRENMDTIEGNANGTTFMEISKKNFRPIPAVVPPPPVVEKFVEIVSPSP
jgi:type I restriction enzyme S subunit